MNKEELLPHLRELQQKGESTYNMPIDILCSIIQSMDRMKDMLDKYEIAIAKQNTMLELSAGIKVDPFTQKN